LVFVAPALPNVSIPLSQAIQKRIGRLTKVPALSLRYPHHRSVSEHRLTSDRTISTLRRKGHRVSIRHLAPVLGNRKPEKTPAGIFSHPVRRRIDSTRRHTFAST